MRIRSILSSSVLSVALAACGGGGGGGGSDGLSAAILPIPFDVASFSGNAIDNPFFPLVPGTFHYLEGNTEDGFERAEIEVTTQTKTILGVVCVVVHAIDKIDGVMREETFDWYAQDDDGNVWYFGEDTFSIEQGTAGSFEAGVNGAQAGLIMLANPTVGTEYSEEFADNVAEDVAIVVGLDETVITANGTFTGCLHTGNRNPLEPDVTEEKWYAPGVGVVLETNSDGDRIERVP